MILYGREICLFWYCYMESVDYIKNNLDNLKRWKEMNTGIDFYIVTTVLPGEETRKGEMDALLHLSHFNRPF